jgi:hypothetical protein
MLAIGFCIGVAYGVTKAVEVEPGALVAIAKFAKGLWMVITAH